MIIVVRMQPNEIQSQPWNAVYFAVFFIIYSNRYTIYSQIDSSILQHKLCIATCSSYKHQHWCTKNNEQLKSQNDLESIQIKTRLKCIVWIWFDLIRFFPPVRNAFVKTFWLAVVFSSSSSMVATVFVIRSLQYISWNKFWILSQQNAHWSFW